MFYLQVDGAIQETKNLMNIIAKVVTTSFICATKVSFICTVKPVLRGHDLWDKEKVTL